MLDAGEAIALQVLGAEDLPLLRAVNALFGRAFEDEASYTGRPPDDAYLRRLLGNEGFVAIAALAGPQVVGALAGYVLPKFEQARSELYLYDLAVDRAWRRRGVAARLIEHLQAVAAQRGIGVIFVQADLGDEPAIALYAKLGRREEVLHFDILPRRGA
jgi:aminoglycoside 3-N-acetyltransferase I